jgi:hypothetical protein
VRAVHIRQQNRQQQCARAHHIYGARDHAR